MRHSRSGFNLIEILLGGVLLLTLVVPLLGFLGDLTRQAGLTRARIVARTLARSVVERYRLEQLDELAGRLQDGRAGADAIQADRLLQLPAGPLKELAQTHRYRRSAVVERLPDGRRGVLTVRVEWIEEGHPRDYVLKTLIVNDELPAGWSDGGNRP